MPNLRNNCLLRTGKGPNQSDAQKQCRTHMPPGKLVRDDTATLTTTANCPPTLPTANLPASSCSWLSCCTAPVKGPPAGLKHHGSEGRSGPAAGSPDCQTLLSELPRNFQTLLLPALLHCQLPTCLRRLAAGFRAARLRSRDPSQGSNTMAVKDGAGPRPAAQTAKRCFLNCLETSFKPCFYLPSCTANCQLACVVLQLAFVLPASSCSWLSCCTAPVKGPPRRAQTPWQ